MRSSNFLIFISLFGLSSTVNDDDCNSDASKTAPSSVFSRVTKEMELYSKSLLQSIEVAHSSYEECVSNNCSCFLGVIKSDLTPFKEGITIKQMNLIRNRGTTYVVFQKRLYRSKDCVFPARCSGVEFFLKTLLPKLPNTEFVLNTRDWPQISKDFGEKGPVLSFSKTPDYLDIHFPAWAFWEGGPAIKSYPTGIGRWDLMRKKLLQKSEDWPWEKKLDKGFFRGSRTSHERDTLVLLSRRYPDLVDAQYTKNQAWKSPADTLDAEPATEVSLEEHCQYKYLFNMRGVAASFRLKHLFLCGSLVIHFGDEWSEFFYSELKPWIHYVPVAATASEEDLLKLLTFLKENDEVVVTIAKNGQRFIRDHLSLKEVKCYWRVLLKRYTKLLQSPVSLDPSLVEVV